MTRCGEKVLLPDKMCPLYLFSGLQTDIYTSRLASIRTALQAAPGLRLRDRQILAEWNQSGTYSHEHRTGDCVFTIPLSFLYRAIRSESRDLHVMSAYCPIRAYMIHYTATRQVFASACFHRYPSSSNNISLHLSDEPIAAKSAVLA